MIYIGDSKERDMKPAMAERIFSFLVVERENADLDAEPPPINALGRLLEILNNDSS
jgi:hypothetical protein